MQIRLKSVGRRHRCRRRPATSRLTRSNFEPTTDGGHEPVLTSGCSIWLTTCCPVGGGRELGRLIRCERIERAAARPPAGQQVADVILVVRRLIRSADSAPDEDKPAPISGRPSRWQAPSLSLSGGRLREQQAAAHGGALEPADCLRRAGAETARQTKQVVEGATSRKRPAGAWRREHPAIESAGRHDPSRAEPSCLCPPRSSPTAGRPRAAETSRESPVSFPLFWRQLVPQSHQLGGDNCPKRAEPAAAFPALGRPAATCCLLELDVGRGARREKPIGAAGGLSIGRRSCCCRRRRNSPRSRSSPRPGRPSGPDSRLLRNRCLRRVHQPRDCPPAAASARFLINPSRAQRQQQVAGARPSLGAARPAQSESGRQQVARE